jgi:hypothetical protein
VGHAPVAVARKALPDLDHLRTHSSIALLPGRPTGMGGVPPTVDRKQRTQPPH